jgi:uncharacterized coiled-coil DUF342 family protein
MNEIRAFKEYLEAHLDDLKDRAPERKHEIAELYGRITLAYEQMLNASLVGNEEIERLTAQLDTIHQGVQRAMDQNDDIAGIIDKVSTGVGIATKIAGFLIKA